MKWIFPILVDITRADFLFQNTFEMIAMDSWNAYLQVFPILVDIVQTEDVLMLNKFHNCNLSLNLPNYCTVILAIPFNRSQDTV
jgi:hypothetical protein